MLIVALGLKRIQKTLAEADRLFSHSKNVQSANLLQKRIKIT
jgi:hypothetical protein